jgi:hypothetical protein
VGDGPEHLAAVRAGIEVSFDFVAPGLREEAVEEEQDLAVVGALGVQRSSISGANLAQPPNRAVNLSLCLTRSR